MKHGQTHNEVYIHFTRTFVQVYANEITAFTLVLRRPSHRPSTFLLTMNINLTNATAKKRKAKKSGSSKSSVSKKKRSVFEEDDSASDDNDHSASQPISRYSSSTSARAGFNRELIAEQAALRKQAEKVMGSSSHTIIDYDGDYESFSAGHKHQEQKKKEDTEESKRSGVKKESRYVGALLKKAKDRQQEREIIMERKIAKEQALEEENDEYAGKEKFITKAYKQKLAEREAWMKEDEKRTKLEELEDVTKQNHQGAMVGFYNSIIADDNEKATRNRFQSTNKDSRRKGQGATENIREERSNFRQESPTLDEDDVIEEEESDFLRQSRRAKQLEKIFAARDRYLERRGALLCQVE